MHTVEWTPEDQFRGMSELGKVLDTDSVMAVFRDYVTQISSEWNTEMFLAIHCVLHWGILIIPLTVKLKNYTRWIWAGWFMMVAFYSRNPKNAWNAR